MAVAALLGWLVVAGVAVEPRLSTWTSAHAASASSASEVNWVSAATDTDIEQAYARARAEKKPVLLYWGASWCPPCNQLKATLFKRQDFVRQTQSLVAVHVDGDLPGAQKLGARFKVRGYPTMILLDAAGNELTRLPGEIDAPQVMAALQLGLSGGRPAKAILADARAGKPLTPSEWKALAFYAWELDEAQLAKKEELPALLAQLARLHAEGKAADPSVNTRLWMKSLTVAEEGKVVAVDAALRERIKNVLAQPKASREHMDVLVNGTRELVRALGTSSDERQWWAKRLDVALKRLQSDATLSRADRGSALIGRIHLARLSWPKDAVNVTLEPALLSEVQAYVAKDDRDIRDGYERQAVITSHAYALSLAGLWAASDDLLKRNLSKSHSPYYLMSQLAGNARKQGRVEEALQWYEQSYDKSVGPATRLQWGSGYVSALVDLSPKDEARIEKAVVQVLQDAAKDSGAFYERSARSMQRVGQKVSAWGQSGQHGATLQRLGGELNRLCSKVPEQDGQKATCEGLFKGKVG